MDELEQPSESRVEVEPILNWEPRLNPSQKKSFDDPAEFILSFGEKMSGKSWGALNALVRHCYEEKDALALIIAVNIRSGKEGTIYDLERVLDIWRNGNIDRDGNRLDQGLGEAFEFTKPKLDPQTKDRHMFIGNRHGGWSKVVLMSIPYAEVVQARMKSISPSFVFMEEITEMNSEDYFTYVAAQLNRRYGISGPQQFYAACNPEGPSHWVYKRFWEKCLDPKTGLRSNKYSVYHVPIMENVHNLPPNAMAALDEVLKDPIMRARLLRGEWIDRPSGEAIFMPYYREQTHKHGDVIRNTGLTPFPQWPMIVSYDPGPVNFSVHFMQMVPVKVSKDSPRIKVMWLVFDEINLVGKRMPYFLVVPKILDRMDFWDTRMGNNSKFIHIAPRDAFNQLNNDGSYDATVIQNLSRPAAVNGEIQPPRIRLRACPQIADSVVSRVQMLISLLLDESMVLSALCTKTHQMFTNLESKKGSDDKYEAFLGLEPKRSIYLHPFDSLTYAPYYFTLNPARFATQTANVESHVYTAGRG